MHAGRLRTRWRVAALVIVVATALGGFVTYQVRWRDGGRARPFADTLREIRPRAHVEPRHAVGVRTVTYRDPTRPTGDSPGRVLPTTVYYPAAGEAGADAGLRPRPLGGPHPLVLFAHGSALNVMNGATEEERRAQTATPAHYDRLLRTWAAAGYVVAAPAFPLTGGHTPGRVVRNDYVNQPADLSVVLDGLLAANAARSGWLSGVLDADAVAAAGHDLGATTVMGLVYNDCCRDERVKVAVPMGMSLLPFGDGGWFDGVRTPMLLMQTGAEDPRGTRVVFREARVPRVQVLLAQRAHLGPLRLIEQYPARLYA
jgi:hypothetical protein